MVAQGPVALATSLTNYRTLKIVACKTLAGPTAAPNACRVNIGNSGAANQQPFDLTPGMERSFDAAPGKQEDLQKWFLAVQTDGDGVALVWS